MDLNSTAPKVIAHALFESYRGVRWVRNFEGMRVALGMRASTIHVDVPALAANDDSPADALVELLGD